MDIDKTAERRGIPRSKILGVSTADVRKTAKKLVPCKELAEELWSSEFHEARLLAVLVYPAAEVSRSQLDRWLKTIDSWDLCDHFCKNLALGSADLQTLIAEWTAGESLYTRRAGLASMANHCMRCDQLDESQAGLFISRIVEVSTDDRQHVKQACCWALRELGKINDACHDQAVNTALELIESSSKTSVWVGKCAYRELETLIKVPERRRLLSSKSKVGSRHT